LALALEEPGPKPVDQRIVVDEAMLKRAISIFPLVKGSIRDIQTGLALLFGVERSVGYISQTLQEVGECAVAYNRQMVGSKPANARANINVAIELLQALGRDDITKFAHNIDKHLDALVAPLSQLESQLAAVRADLSPEDEALITWLWQHRHELDLSWIVWLPDALQPVARC
jgi:hypothetical protein